MAKQPTRPNPSKPTKPSRPQPGGSPGRQDENKGIGRPPSRPTPPKK